MANDIESAKGFLKEIGTRDTILIVCVGFILWQSHNMTQINREAIQTLTKAIGGIDDLIRYRCKLPTKDKDDVMYTTPVSSNSEGNTSKIEICALIE